METQLIELDRILDNPYQPRTTDDAGHIENLARSIAADGMLQAPKARPAPNEDVYQLAFGHSRRKAFEWLRENYDAQRLPERYQGYTLMPISVEHMTDEQMYRNAVSENVQRKDLDPIETARAMKRYADEFGKTSKEIGELFGMKDATVRGKVRLLDLPTEVQTELSSGALSESAARMFLVLQRLDADAIPDALASIKDGDDPQEEIEYRLRESKKTKYLNDSFSEDEKKFKYLPEYASVAELRKDIGNEPVITDDELSAWMADAKKAKKTLPEDHPTYLKLFHLIKPPACTACDHYAVVGAQRVCGLVACFERKRAAANYAEFMKTVEASGIAIYGAEDGKQIKINSHDDSAKYVEEKHADLRLIYTLDLPSWKSLDGFVNAQVVAVGGLAEKIAKAAVKSGHIPETGDKQQEAELRHAAEAADRKRRVESKVAEEQVEIFLFEVVAARVTFLDEIKSLDFLKAMYERMDTACDLYDAQEGLNDMAKAVQLRLVRQAITNSLVENALRGHWQEYRAMLDAKKPGATLAKLITPELEAWGVKLGKDWDARVAALDAAIAEARRVAVETEA